MKYDIFISYRREGGYDTAKHLNDLLVRDGYRVSFDIDTLRNGDFDVQLLERIEECKDFILIVDKHAFDRTLDPDFDPQKDWLRCELAHALMHNINIIPIFLAGINSFPDNLPNDIAYVARRNGPVYDRYYFDAFYDKLKRMFLESQPNSNITNEGESLVVTRIYPDTDCEIYLFGQKIGIALKNEFYELRLPKGENALKFICTIDNTIFSDEIVDITDCQRVVKVSLERKLLDKRKRIEYITSDGQKLNLSKKYWDIEIINHTYENGKGVIACKEEIARIGRDAFMGCRNLISITIPSSVKTIEERAFCDCLSLTSITIPDNVIQFGDGAFNGCKNLSAFYGKWASADNRCLIVDGELKAFASAGLTTYTIPNYVTKIGGSAFYGCGLASITIPNSVIIIGEKAFEYCRYLTSIAIPESITKIGGYAFYGCGNLQEVHITNLSAWCGIDFPGYYTGNPLSNGAKLYLNGELITNLVISDNITKIGTNTFHGCRSLTSVNINDSVKFIENNAFSYCENLASVTIGNGVTSIGSGAFYNCSKLSSVTIGSSVTSIYDSAFGSCSNLTKIDIGNSVNKLGSFVFSSCKNLTTITIPSSIISIGADIFEGCTNLACVYCKAFTPPEVAPYNSQGLGLDNNAIIYVANAAVTKYKNTQKWNEYNINEWTF